MTENAVTAEAGSGGPAMPVPGFLPPTEHNSDSNIALLQNGNCGCGCGSSDKAAASPSYVYAIGRISWRYPSLAVEKEFAQAIGRADSAGQSDAQAFHDTLAQKQNRYLLRSLCWLLTIEGVETYLLRPRDLSELELLHEAVRPSPSPLDIDVVIGTRGGIAPPDYCNGLMLPIVTVDQVYSFDRDNLIATIPRPDNAEETRFKQSAAEILDRIMQMADNAGSLDEHRALNYLAVRYPHIYSRAVQAHEQSFTLAGVETRTSRLSTARRLVDVIFTYTHRSTDVSDRYFVRVDVTEEFPFLATKLSPYFDHS